MSSDAGDGTGARHAGPLPGAGFQADRSHPVVGYMKGADMISSEHWNNFERGLRRMFKFRGNISRELLFLNNAYKKPP